MIYGIRNNEQQEEVVSGKEKGRISTQKEGKEGRARGIGKRGVT